MILELMYITNNINIAKIADNAGVNRVWIDLEKLGKAERQKGDTVKSNHQISDISKIKPILKNSSLLVRINPINSNTRLEIDRVIENGADIIMLPFYKTTDEVKIFLSLVNGRVKTCLLLETKEAHKCLLDTMELSGIDEFHVGLNDLHLSYNKQFMFELLIDGTVEDIVSKIKGKNIPFGFGGIARLNSGLVPAEYIISEHYRLGSTRVILSRSFCNSQDYFLDPVKFEKEFILGVNNIRKYESGLLKKDNLYFKENQKILKQKIMDILI